MTTARLISETHSTAERPRYRVYHFFNLPHNQRYYAVESPEEARALIERLAEADLKDPHIDSNVFGLEELEVTAAGTSEYSEWYDENGEDINYEEE